MIRVTRPPASAEARKALNKKNRAGLTERQRAVGHFLRGHPKKKPSYRAYKSRPVKQQLRALFGFKCAYCESDYAAVGPMEVEHYRPKNAYLKEDATLSARGYYWLAAEWSNLLPSCADCNRERMQVRRASDGKIMVSKSGKANKFPLVKGTPRAMRPNQHTNETPLLLDPCGRTDPSKYLVFGDDGTIHAATNRAEANAPKGASTIEVCGLDREDLRRARKAWLKSLKSQMKRLCECTVDARDMPAHARFRERANDARNELENRVARNQKYSAMGVQMLISFEATLATAQTYWKAEEQLNERETPARRRAMRQAIADLKKRLGEDRHDKRLIREVLGWLGITVPV